jgi:hypothetical protein
MLTPNMDPPPQGERTLVQSVRVLPRKPKNQNLILQTHQLHNKNRRSIGALKPQYQRWDYQTFKQESKASVLD